MKFVDVTNDIAFRKIFGSDNKKKSLISFLNAVLDFPEKEKIVDVEIMTPYQMGRFSGWKSTIVDVKAKDEKGKVFIVEMQVAKFDFFHKRVLYYSAQAYIAQINKGDEYNRLRPVYFIGILGFELGQDTDYFSRHKVLNIKTLEQVVQDMEFNFIELPKFNKTIDQLENDIDQWAYFIKNAENLTLIPETIKDEGLKEAYHEAEQQNWSEQDLDDYLRASIKVRDDLGRIEYAERKAEERGIEKGKIEGKIEKMFETANQGIAMGLSNLDISKLSGLSVQEIENLRVVISRK